MDAVYDLIKENHAISRAELARRLETSERQVRKAIDELRDKKIRRKGGDSGEWEIIDSETGLKINWTCDGHPTLIYVSKKLPRATLLRTLDPDYVEGKIRDTGR